MRATRTRTIAALVLILFLLSACTGPGEQEPGAPGVPPDRWKIVFVGNMNLSDRELRRASEDDLIVFQKAGKEYMADNAAYAMEEHYRESGFPSARVTFEIEEGQPGKAVFRIQEGPRTLLGEIDLPESGDAPRKTLMRFFTGPSSSWLGGEMLYVQSRVEDAARLIEQWYRAEGYLRAEVDEPEVTFRDGMTRADVCVVIRPGLKYSIQEVRFEGVGDTDARVLLEELEQPVGLPFTRSWMTWAVRRLTAFFRSLGHVDPVIEGISRPNHETGHMAVVFTMEPGPIRKVGRIAVEGQDRTSESFLRSLIRIEAGDRFDGDAVKETTDALYKTGLFRSMNVEETPVGEDGVDLAFLVEERETRDISFLAGYGSYELIRGGATYMDRNLFGKGLIWSTSLKLSFRSARLKSSLSDPRFLNLPLTGTVEGFTERRDFPSYIERRYGGVAFVSKDWFNRLNTAVGYSYEKSWADSVEPGASVVDIGERVALGTVFTRWTLDYRNGRVFPTRGSLNEAKFEVASDALGSELDFNRITGRSAWHFSLDADDCWVLGLRGEAGLILRKSGTSLIPIQHRFFNGGADSVRSFRQDELGPKVSGDPVGGEYYSTGSIELRTPLYRRLNAAFFGDAGNVIARRSDVGLHEYRYALGLGLRYGLPIGPIRLDWGWNPNRRSDEELWALHLSMGFPF